MKKLKKDLLFWISGLFIFLIATFLRLNSIHQQGLFYYDEAWYRLTAQTFFLLPKFILATLQGTSGPDAFNTLYHWGFYPEIAYKPTYLLLLMFSDLIFGLYNPFSGAAVSIVMGLGIVVLLFLLVRHLTQCTWIALSGSLLSALSGLEVSYSRLTFPHQLAGFSLIAYLYFYIAKRLQIAQLTFIQQYGLGIITGLLLTTHDQMLPVMLFLAAFETGVLLFRGRFKPLTIIPITVFLSGVATPLLFWELVTLLLREFFQDTLGKRYTDLYFNQVFGHVTSHNTSVNDIIHNTDFLYFFKVLLITEGPLFLCLMLIGGGTLLFQLWKKKSVETLFLTSVIFIFGTLISIYPSKVLRLAVPFFPLGILVATLGFYTLSRLPLLQNIKLQKTKLKPVILASLLLATVWMPLNYSSEFSKLSSGYAAASQDLVKLTTPKEAIATPYNFPLYTFYTQQKVQGFKSKKELEKIIQEKNVRYVVYEFEQLHKLCHNTPALCTAVDPKNQSREALLSTEDPLKPYFLKSYPNPFRLSPTLLMDSHYSYEMIQALTQDPQTYRLNEIRVYKLPNTPKLNNP